MSAPHLHSFIHSPTIAEHVLCVRHWPRCGDAVGMETGHVTHLLGLSVPLRREMVNKIT